MIIKNSVSEDIDEIFRLYETATALQIEKSAVPWPRFERQLIETEILDNRQWQLRIDERIACIWATAFNDPVIWGELDSDPSLYIHRIATNPEFRGKNFVQNIVKWAKNYAMLNHKKFIRMDTVGNNTGLINYYKKCGFDFLSISPLQNTAGLPAHYERGEVCLFQMKI